LLKVVLIHQKSKSIIITEILLKVALNPINPKS
jgi:hypothetical protein